MTKKILKFVGIVFLLLIASLFAAPFLFKEQIKEKITAAINQKINAKVGFAAADLSLIKNFPNASVSLQKLVIINKAPFEGDTLVALEELNLKMSVMALFKGKNEPIAIESFSAKNGLVNVIFDKNGLANYDIALKDETPSTEASASSPLNLKIEGYEIENFRIRYTDQKSKIKMQIDSLNHQGTGNFAAQNLDLDTKTTANFTLDMDKVNYMRNLHLTLDAVLGIDLANNKYTFKENKALINQLPLEFDGFVQMAKEGQLYDLKFKTPTSSFKNFLALIPAAYASSLEGVTTTGDFSIVGFAKGMYNDTTVPKFNIQIAAHNASFQYPNLPKSVRNIVIDTKIINESGLLNDTYINLDKLSFAIDKDVFDAKANIKNITQNALVAAALKGTINLSNLSKAYPIKLDIPLSGILKADVTTNFDMQAVEKSDYHSIKNAGMLGLSGFNYVDENGKKLAINNALIQFNPSQVNLKEFKATTGKSDLNVTGVLENFYGFMFKNQELKGNFALASNQFAVSDFMTAPKPSEGKTTSGNSDDSKTSKSAQKAEAMKIPAFLNCTLTAKANTVLYDNLVLKAVSGKVIIKDQKASLENVKTAIFGGTIGVNGSVSTKEKVPVFAMDLKLNQVDIQQSFTQLDMLKQIAPIAGIINGKINSTMKFNGNLDESLSPSMNTLTGNLLGQLLSTTINAKNSSLLNSLGANLKFIDMSKINLNNIKAAISFKDGKVNVKPFDIKYKDITASLGGTHGIDQSMNYSLKLDLPAKYLGNEANALLAKMSPEDAAKLKNIPLTALISGSFSQPKISTDMKAVAANLANQLVKTQKEKLIKKGTTALTDLINKNTKKSGDSTKTNAQKEDIKAKAADILNGLFKKKVK